MVDQGRMFSQAFYQISRFGKTFWLKSPEIYYFLLFALSGGIARGALIYSKSPHFREDCFVFQSDPFGVILDVGGTPVFMGRSAEWE